jgi:hypothetical protein
MRTRFFHLVPFVLSVLGICGAQADPACQPNIVKQSKKYDLGPGAKKRGNFPIPGVQDASMTVVGYDEQEQQLTIQAHSLMNLEYTPTSVPADTGHLCKFGLNYQLRMHAQKSYCAYLPFEGNSYSIVTWDPAAKSEDENGESHVMLSIETRKLENPKDSEGHARCHANLSVEPFVERISGGKQEAVK